MTCTTRRTGLLAVALACAALLLTGSAGAEQQTAEAYATGTSGDSLFRTYCASCHGASGAGDGPLANHLRFRPPDLTLMAKHSDGRFDADETRRIIDGRNPVKGHGGPDMPVWGDAFKRSGEGYSEKAVEARIQALTEYLESIQKK